MKAAVIEHYGSPEEFIIKDLPSPDIKDGQVLVENKASSVNPVDTLVRQGKTKLITGIIGDQLLGSDFSGIVIQSRSDKFKVGDEVFGLNSAVKGGSYAEQIVVDQEDMTFKPVNLSFTEAAVLPLVGLTAWQGLVTEGKIQKGDRVLITGCTGGVGSVAVQIAKTFDAHITGTCSAKNRDFAESLGVNRIIDYETEKISSDQIFDLIFDASGHFTISDLKENLTQDAMFVTTKGGADDLKGIASVAIDLTFQKRMKIVVMEQNSVDLNILKALVEEGKLKPFITKTFSLDNITEAHRMMEDDSFNGKIAIQIGN